MDSDSNRNNLEFKVLYEDKHLFSRLGKLKINNKKLDTPSLFLGHLMDHKPKLWETSKLDNLMVNAYFILKKASTYNKIVEMGIHKYLDYEGLVMMDSGGYLFQKKEEMDLDPLKVLDLYENYRPDIGVVLDHPFDPNSSNLINKKRWDITLKNTAIMIESNSKVPLMPVIHGYSLKELEKACSDIKKIDDDPKLIGLGSLVPLIFSTTAGSKRFPDCMQFVMQSVKLIRREFPDAMIHAFGIGSTLTMHLMYSVGTDSLDSTGWRIKAAYGMIQLPGVSDRHVKTRNNGRRHLDIAEKRILAKCECPICNGKNIEERMDILDENFIPRAVHNAWVFKKEEEYFKDALKERNTRKFLDKRLNKSYYSKSFNYLIDSKEVKTLSGWI